MTHWKGRGLLGIWALYHSLHSLLFWPSQARCKTFEFLHDLNIYWTAFPWFTFRYKITLPCGVQGIVPILHSFRLGLNWLASNNLSQLLGHRYSFMDRQDSDLIESMHCILLAFPEPVQVMQPTLIQLECPIVCSGSAGTQTSPPRDAVWSTVWGTVALASITN